MNSLPGENHLPIELLSYTMKHQFKNSEQMFSH